MAPGMSLMTSLLISLYDRWFFHTDQVSCHQRATPQGCLRLMHGWRNELKGMPMLDKRIIKNVGHACDVFVDCNAWFNRQWITIG